MVRKLLRVALLCAGSVSVALAEDDDTARRVARDLLTVITMEGLPCGEVVGTVRHADEDYTAECKSGDRYRVRIVEGRVVVERA